MKDNKTKAQQVCEEHSAWIKSQVELPSLDISRKNQFRTRISLVMHEDGSLDINDAEDCTPDELRVIVEFINKWYGKK